MPRCCERVKQCQWEVTSDEQGGYSQWADVANFAEQLEHALSKCHARGTPCRVSVKIRLVQNEELIEDLLML